ncbi:hypothetical protein DSO57_1001545 [Entomophthora muscae]|uniref:Uncharacterized protein n=1 Tax=Entomophthora muscae TaxID=34485 RepID=A0ACC2RNY3_9FUNG|nr:hypothetical protein DSO57_1001545 [Entomophthora muscae]
MLGGSLVTSLSRARAFEGNSDALRFVREFVGRRFLVTCWCPTAPNLAIVIPFPLKLKPDQLSKSMERSNLESPPKRSKCLGTFVNYKLWLIRLTKPHATCGKSIEKEPYEKIDAWKFSVNLSRADMEKPSDFKGVQSEEEVVFFKELAARALKISWHPVRLEFYLVYNTKVTTIFPVKKVLSNESLQDVQINPKPFPSPLEIGNGSRETTRLRPSTSNSVFLSIGVSIENCYLKVSSLNTVSCNSRSPLANSEKYVLPHSLHWIFDKNMYTKAVCSRDDEAKSDTFRLLTESGEVATELKPLNSIPHPILVIQSHEGDLYLCIAGKYHIKTLPSSEIYQNTPPPLDLTLSSNVNWEVTIKTNQGNLPPIDMKKYVSFERLKSVALFQKVVTELQPLRLTLEEVWQNLQVHSSSYQSHVKNLRCGSSTTKEDSPTSILRDFLVGGVMTPELCVFLGATEINKHELWIASYTSTVEKSKAKIETSVFRALEKIILELSCLGTLSRDGSIRSALRTASRFACGLYMRSHQFVLKLDEDLSHFKPFAQTLIHYSKLFAEDESVQKPAAIPVDKLALTFLDRANCFGPTQDLLDFFVSDVTQVDLCSDVSLALAKIEEVGLFDVQSYELLFNPIEGPNATITLLFNSLLSTLNDIRSSFSFLE